MSVWHDCDYCDESYRDGVSHECDVAKLKTVIDELRAELADLRDVDSPREID